MAYIALTLSDSVQFEARRSNSDDYSLTILDVDALIDIEMCNAQRHAIINALRLANRPIRQTPKPDQAPVVPPCSYSE